MYTLKIQIMLKILVDTATVDSVSEDRTYILLYQFS